jgi:hypothetical protein
MIKEWQISIAEKHETGLNFHVIVDALTGRFPFARLQTLVEHFKEVYPADQYHVDVLERPVPEGRWLDTDNLKGDRKHPSERTDK